MPARENILARLRAAQNNRGEIEMKTPDFTSSIYHPLNDSLSAEFKNNLELIGGKVILCQSKAEISGQIQLICEELNQNQVFCLDNSIAQLIRGNLKIKREDSDLMQINIGLTGCEFLVAHLGSVLISSAQVSGRRLNVFPETQIVVAGQNQLTGYLEEAMEKLRGKYKNSLPSLISNITGPSRTADIEKTLVMGMHGPKSLIVIISEEPI